jgi:hypothetical protein
MPNDVVEISLPNGSTALARVAAVDGVGATKTKSPGKLDFGDVGETLAGLAEGIRSALEKVAPDTVQVELGIELAVKNGKLTGLVVEGEGKGSLKVTLGWGSGGASG